MSMDANLFTEGAVYYYENKTNTKSDYKNESLNHDFLVSRPVYVLKSNSSPEDEFTINVLAITSSQHRIGIPINIDGLRNGKILPGSIRSVHKEYLTKYMGHVSEDLKEEVFMAVKYHLGYTDKKPKYMVEYEHNQSRKEKIIKNLTPMQKTVYDFLEKKCVFKENYFATFDELYTAYRKFATDDGYCKVQPVSKAFKRISEEIFGVTCRIENRTKIFYGMGINGNVHKLNLESELKARQKKNVLLENVSVNDSDIDTMTNQELFMLLDEGSKNVYKHLDIAQKISNYTKSAYHLDIPDIDVNDIHIMKKMIENDVDFRKKKVFRMLDSGEGPVSFNTIDQYVFYICSDEEIMEHISRKYIKKGGINALRRTVRNNIKHYFVKIKM